MNIFKKVNKLYTTVFGNNLCGSPINAMGEQDNIVDSVRAHKWQLKNQAIVLEALIDHLGLKHDTDWSDLTDNKKVTFKKK